MEYYTMTTNAGDEAIANALKTGKTTTFKDIAVGDGGGTYYEPSKSQTALHGEVWRGNAEVSIDPNNIKRVICTTTIPATVGGFTIREAGIFDTNGTLMVVSKLPLSEKVAPESGASSDLVIRIYVEVSDAKLVNITIDPSAVMATRDDVLEAEKRFSSNLNAELKKANDKIGSHTSDTVSHIQPGEREKWNASGISTYKHEKNGTVHNLKGTGRNIIFLATADFADGDTWTVNGKDVTATLSNGEPLTEDTFKSGNWVTGVRLDGDKLNFRSGGGGGCKLNIFCTNTLPTKDFEGIVLKTDNKFSRIIFDNNAFEGGDWVIPSGIADMPTARTLFGCAVVSTKIYCIGGYTGSNYLSTVEIYDTTTNTWSTGTNMPTERYELNCTNVGTKIYCIGGLDSGHHQVHTVEIYDTTTNTWSTGRDTPSVRSEFGCASVGTNIYCIGGVVSGDYQLNTVEIYDTTTNTWSTGTNMPTKRYKLSCTNVGTNIYCIGGYGNSKNVVEIYDTTTNTWSTGTNMPTERYGFGCVSVGTNIYCIGGSSGLDSSNHLLHTVEIYDTTTNTWSTGRDMPSVRSEFGCASVGTNIYCIGGRDANNKLSSVEVYSLISKQYSENTFVVLTTDSIAKYATQFITSKLIKSGRLLSWFENAWLFKNGDLQNYDGYYGDGTQWVKFK